MALYIYLPAPVTPSLPHHEDPSPPRPRPCRPFRRCSAAWFLRPGWKHSCQRDDGLSIHPFHNTTTHYLPRLRCSLVTQIQCTSSTRSREMQLRLVTIPLMPQNGKHTLAFSVLFLNNPNNRDIATRTATAMDVQTDAFCSSGMHLPNGSYVTFGGNTAVGPGGDNSDPGSTIAYDPVYQDYDGTRAIRIISPCSGSLNSAQCTWYDAPNGLQMAKSRWYSATEALSDGTVVIIGGFVNGGYINRMYPNTDPQTEGGAAEPTFEFYPARSQTPQVMNFMVKTSGLNAYALTFLMPSGKMFLQANYSTSKST